MHGNIGDKSKGRSVSWAQPLHELIIVYIYIASAMKVDVNVEQHYEFMITKRTIEFYITVYRMTPQLP